MILDNNLVFSSAQAANITVSTASTNVIDLEGGIALNIGYGTIFGEDLGRGNGIGSPRVVVSVGTALTSTNSATLNVAFQGSTDSSTWTTYIETGAIAASGLTLNKRIADFSWPVVPSGAALPRYVRLYYQVATGVFATGTISAFVTLDSQLNNVGDYPEAFVVGP